MTTIAYRGGILAADTLIAYTHYTNGTRDKIAECGDYHVAMAGPTYLKSEFEGWVRSGCSASSVPPIIMDNQHEFSAILVAPWGAAFEFGHGYLIPIDADYHAIGSGAQFAMGAMAFGASAEDAIQCAMAHDKATGGHVTTYTAPFFSAASLPAENMSGVAY